MKKLDTTATIQTNHGEYKYQEIYFSRGVKKIDREIAKQNLLDLKKCMSQHELKFGLIYGTLLGAVREKNFIEHDEDTDLFMLMEEREKFMDILFELRKIGFEVGRHEEKMISIIRDGEYIDFYFFKKKAFNIRECDGYTIKAKHLENLEEYEFLGEIFYVPQNPEELLNSLYGKDWRIPNKNGSTQNYGLELKTRIFIRDHIHPLFTLLSFIKNKIFVKSVVA